MVLFFAALAFASQASTAEPEIPVCTAVHAPLPARARTRYASVARRVTSSFGDGRRSFQRGHLHAGVDLAAKASESVFAICEGTVVNQHLGFPHTTLIVAHRSPGGAVFYSSYKHVADVEVRLGERVGPSTRLARVFTQEEQSQAGWKLLHLHFELRRSIADEGSASWSSMTRKELQKWAYNPEIYLRKRMKHVKRRSTKR